jgi:hypothetical protein
MEEKRQLYFEQGAKEVWICKNGHINFYNAQQQIQKSALAPEFPNIIDI